MSLRLFNTLSRQKEVFIPLTDKRVKIYVCGVTVYDFCHLGHARAYIVWDVVRRYLEFSGYNVEYVQNITDVDDKILKRAQEENVTITELTDRFIQEYNKDMASLNIKPADRYPKATEHIQGMIEIIQSLIDKDVAYVVGGDVYYAVQKFPSYGKLSHRSLDSMQAGASGRVADSEGELKRYPFDFALWKAAKPGEPYWSSPWGNGRPGWHIECSAMVKSCLGETIDIHAGGADLQFPHHENEIAQSEAHTGKPLARYWMHNGFVNIGGQKMSKSLKNFKTIRSVLEYYDPMAVRLFILQAHYRQPIDFTEEAMDSATKSWQLIHEGLKFNLDFAAKMDWCKDQELKDNQYLQDFRSAMDDDFNTPVALSIVFELAKILKKERNLLEHGSANHLNSHEVIQIQQTLQKICDTLGLTAANSATRQSGTLTIQAELLDTNHHINQTIPEEEIQLLIAQRKEAKKQKNYKEADRIRDELKAKGIELIDQKGGETIWKYISS